MAKSETPTSMEALCHAINVVEKDGPMPNLDTLWRRVAEEYTNSVDELGLSRADFPPLTHSTVRNRCIAHKIVPKTPSGKARSGSIFKTVEKEVKPTRVKQSDIRKIAITLLDDDNGISSEAFEAIKQYFPADVVEKAYKNDTTGNWHLNGDDAEDLSKVDVDEKVETAAITSETTVTETPAITDETIENVAEAMISEGSPVDEENNAVA